MRTTTNDSLFHAELSELGVESTKRLMTFSGSKFPKKISSDAKPPFDDRVKEVVLSYALDPVKLIEELNYLDSMKYGCVFRDGPLLEQIMRFQDNPESGEIHVKPFRWNKNYKRALKRVASMIKPNLKLTVHVYEDEQDILDALPRLDTHAGFEFIKTGLKYKGDYEGEMYDTLKTELTKAHEHGSFAKPILPGFRLQVSGAYDDDGERTGKFKQKVRLVSMVDLYQILAELMFAKPIQGYLGRKAFYAGGKDPSTLHSLVISTKQKFGFWTSLDYSHYDQSIPSWLIEDAFALLWDLFESSKFNKSWKWLWDIIVSDFVNKAFVGPNGTLFIAHDGVPSGSMFTQIIDTICNLIMITTYCEHIESGMRFECIICGDDNLVYTKTPLDMEDVAGYLQRCFGIECNASKCSYGTKGEDPEFLSRVWRTSGTWREPKELWAKLCYPERFRPYDKEPQLSPELIVYSYILCYPLGMKELMDVDKFLKDNAFKMPKWSKTVLDYQSGYLSYAMRYDKLSA